MTAGRAAVTGHERVGGPSGPDLPWWLWRGGLAGADGGDAGVDVGFERGGAVAEDLAACDDFAAADVDGGEVAAAAREHERRGHVPDRTGAGFAGG